MKKPIQTSSVRKLRDPDSMTTSTPTTDALLIKKKKVLRATKIKQWWSVIGVNISDDGVEVCVQAWADVGGDKCRVRPQRASAGPLQPAKFMEHV